MSDSNGGNGNGNDWQAASKAHGDPGYATSASYAGAFGARASNAMSTGTSATLYPGASVVSGGMPLLPVPMGQLVGQTPYFHPLGGMTAQQFQGLAAAAQQLYGTPEPKLADLEDAGITLGEIIAWRVWHVTTEQLLKSVATSNIWAPGEPMVGNVEHAGVHAWKSASGALTYAAGNQALVGKVALWGTVVEHEDGYRAEYAKPVSIEFTMGNNHWPPSLVHKIAKRYGIPVSAEIADAIVEQKATPWWKRR